MNQSLSITKLNNGDWIIESPEAVVFRCIVDFAFTIEAQDNKNTVLIQIWTEFILTANGNSKLISVDDMESVGDALIVFNKNLARGEIFSDGSIRLEFSDNITIEIRSHEQYEPWILDIDDETKIVSLPGGGLAIWDAM